MTYKVKTMSAVGVLLFLVSNSAPAMKRAVSTNLSTASGAKILFVGASLHSDSTSVNEGQMFAIQPYNGTSRIGYATISPLALGLSPGDSAVGIDGSSTVTLYSQVEHDEAAANNDPVSGSQGTVDPSQSSGRCFTNFTCSIAFWHYSEDRKDHFKCHIAIPSGSYASSGSAPGIRLFSGDSCSGSASQELDVYTESVGSSLPVSLSGVGVDGGKAVEVCIDKPETDISENCISWTLEESSSSSRHDAETPGVDVKDFDRVATLPAAAR